MTNEPGPDVTALANGEVHVWSFSLDVSGPRLAQLGALLSEDESARARRFCLEAHRRRFAVARRTLRELLGRYLGRDPASLVFAYGPQGKPAVPDSGLHFNLSHSADRALLALCRDGAVGVDVEAVRAGVAFASIARRFFSPRESATLAALPPEQSAGAFFDCWTRKESFIKAKGGGLTIPLADFDVSFGPGQEARIERVGADPLEAGRWCLQALEVGPGFAAAVTVASPAATVRRFDLGNVI